MIHAQPILDLLCHFIEHAPPQMHLILLSRIDPPLPLARLRARGQLVDIRADQLRFTLEEVEVFLNESMGLKLPAGDVTAMERRTEGWIAGLQLAALSMQGCSDRRGFASAFSGSHYSIMDYLAEEVLKLQSEGVSSFLLKTSILDRLCGSLCSAVIEPDKEIPFDGQALLEDLERKNLFVIPLDNERRWYRYHHLFTDVLNRRLERLYPSLIPELHHRASLWYEQNGLIPEAIAHALKAGDRQPAAKMIEQNGCALLMSGEVITLLGWIEAVVPYVRTHPWVTVQKAWALTLAGRLDEVEQVLQSAEQLISTFEPDGDVRTLQGIIAADRTFRLNSIGDVGLAVKFARQALEYLPEGDPLSRSMRSVSISIIGDASRRSGNLKETAQACIEAARISRVAGNTSLLISNQTDLAGILLEQGQLRQAASLYSESLELAARPGGQRSPLAHRILAGLSRINYEWNQLDRAAEYAHQCIGLCRLVENIELQAVAGLCYWAPFDGVGADPLGKPLSSGRKLPAGFG